MVLGKIISIDENYIVLKLNTDLTNFSNLINSHVIFEEEQTKIIGEIKKINIEKVDIALIGQINNNIFYSGVIRKPSFRTNCRLINKEEVAIIFDSNVSNIEKKIKFGDSPLYNNYPINVSVNKFLSNHFAILGNTGSGKSYAVAKILQNIFYNPTSPPVNANIFLFDVYGEYHGAFTKISQYCKDLSYKTYTTNLKFPDTEVLRIPIWLLGVDEISLLLGANNPLQIPIVEKALRLVSIFAKKEESIIIYKNDIIARALLEILYGGHTPTQIRDQVFAILTAYNTKDLNLKSELVQPGYVRTLRQCLIIDRDGKLQEMQLVTQFISGFIKEELQLDLPDGSFPYTLEHLKEAFNFALISEGILKSDKVYDYANILKVRLHSLINSSYKHYFQYDNYITKVDYINKLLTTPDGKKAQIVNFDINYIDDRMGKVITKIYSKMLYDFVTTIDKRASFPVHIILEEAHRYVQHDEDISLLGYNIFDRITKEGRKYGIVMGMISQSPAELSETAMSQCSNFLIFRMINPRDSAFIKSMLPNINNEMVEKLKTLSSGTCIAFGRAFEISILLSFGIPNPEPLSKNVDIGALWYKKEDIEIL